jgi:hypothetical protein
MIGWTSPDSVRRGRLPEKRGNCEKERIRTTAQQSLKVYACTNLLKEAEDAPWGAATTESGLM